MQDQAHANTAAMSDMDRLHWVDAAKGIGIFLMFYGHYLQRGIDSHNASALDQLRFIYSFHMPMFFVAAGFFFHPTDQWLGRVWQLALRRLVPVIFFSVMLLPLWLEHEIWHHLPLWHDVKHIGNDYASGRPDLDWVTWFLVCLFVSECLAALLIRKAFNVWTLLIIGVLSLAVGLAFCSHSDDPNYGLLYAAGHTWFISEALVALGFFTIGYALFPYFQSIVAHRRIAITLLPIVTILVLMTFRLNHTPDTVVMMAARHHGNPFLFVSTALAGTIVVLMLGILLRNNKILGIIGRSTLLLLGLNGLFFQYVNPKLEEFLPLPDSEVVVALTALIITVLSIAVCMPLVSLINRYLPQLVGKTRNNGPWLPAFENSQLR